MSNILDAIGAAGLAPAQLTLQLLDVIDGAVDEAADWTKDELDNAITRIEAIRDNLRKRRGDQPETAGA
jgi:hypothetical protein